MKKLLLFAIFAVLSSCQYAYGQECTTDCVTISREAAIRAVETAKERDALKIQLATEKQSFDALKVELNEVRIKFAAVSGELSGIKQNAVQDRAIIDLLLKNAKKQCKPFSICVF